MYDVASGALMATHTLPVTAPIHQLVFASVDRLVIDTAVGPFVVDPTGAGAPTPLVDAPASGRVAVLPDGTVVAGMLGTADLVKVRGVEVVQHRLSLDDGETALDVNGSPDGSIIAVASGVGPDLIDRLDRITVLDVGTLTPLATIDTGIALDPAEWVVTDEAIVVARGTDVRVWGLDGSTIGTLPVDSSITALQPVTGALLTVDSVGTLSRWEVGSWTPSVLRTGEPIEHMNLAADQSAVAIVDRFGGIEVRATTDGALIRSEDRFATGELTSVAVAGDGRIGVTSTLGVVTVLDDQLAPQQSFRVSDRPVDVEVVSFSPTTDTIVAGVGQRIGDTAFDDTVRAWSTRGGAEIFEVGGEREDVAGCSLFFPRVRFSPDGRHAAVTSHDFSVVILDASTGAEVRRLTGGTTVLDIAYTVDGSQLVATYDDGMVVVWNTDDFSLESSHRGAQGGYLAIAILPDGDSMVAADLTGAIAVIEIDGGEQLVSFEGASTRTSTLATSADGSLVAAPTSGGGVAIWSTVDGSRLASATEHTGEVTGLAFDPTGEWLATSSSDGTVRTWTIEAAP